MGRVRVLSGGAAGLYHVEKIYNDRIYAQIRASAVRQLELAEEGLLSVEEKIAVLNQSLSEMTDALDQHISDMATAQQAGDDAQFAAAQEQIAKSQSDLMQLRAEISRENLRKSVYQASRIDATETISNLDSVQAPTAQQVWCADLTEDITGEVDAIEIPGEEGGPVLIYPASQEEPIIADRGLITPRKWMTGNQAYFNAALLPGWQRHMPTFRLGEITELIGDFATVQLDPATSSAQALPINKQTLLESVPIRYMTCNGSAFEVGDRVVLEFLDQDPSAAVVIGFESNPRACGSFVLIGKLSGSGPRNSGSIYAADIQSVRKDASNYLMQPAWIRGEQISGWNWGNAGWIQTHGEDVYTFDRGVQDPSAENKDTYLVVYKNGYELSRLLLNQYQGNGYGVFGELGYDVLDGYVYVLGTGPNPVTEGSSTKRDPTTRSRILKLQPDESTGLSVESVIDTPPTGLVFYNYDLQASALAVRRSGIYLGGHDYGDNSDIISQVIPNTIYPDIQSITAGVIDFAKTTGPHDVFDVVTSEIIGYQFRYYDEGNSMLCSVSYRLDDTPFWLVNNSPPSGLLGKVIVIGSLSSIALTDRDTETLDGYSIPLKPTYPTEGSYWYWGAYQAYIVQRVDQDTGIPMDVYEPSGMDPVTLQLQSSGSGSGMDWFLVATGDQLNQASYGIYDGVFSVDDRSERMVVIKTSSPTLSHPDTEENPRHILEVYSLSDGEIVYSSRFDLGDDVAGMQSYGKVVITLTHAYVAINIYHQSLGYVRRVYALEWQPLSESDERQFKLVQIGALPIDSTQDPNISSLLAEWPRKIPSPQ